MTGGLIQLVLLLAALRPAAASTISVDSFGVSVLQSIDPDQPIYVSSDVISLSSITLQGSLGVVSTQSSATASAFFGDGRALGGVLDVKSTSTFSGGAVFQSTLSVISGGRAIILSTGTSGAV